MDYTVGRIIHIYCNQEGYRDKQRFFPPRLHEMSRQSDISTDPFDADGENLMHKRITILLPSCIIESSNEGVIKIINCIYVD